jgi:hypothetical protein
MKKAIIFSILVLFLFGCNGQNATPTAQEMMGIANQNIWSSENFKIEVDKSFRYVGIYEDHNASALRYTSIWRDQGGQVLAILDVKTRKNPFPYDIDWFATKNPETIIRRGQDYAVFNHLDDSNRLKQALDAEIVALPECYTVGGKVRVSYMRSEAVFTFLIEPCGGNDSSKTIDRLDKFFKVTLM